ncbi:hypothetical protein [Bradyrhizobium yuanmingense]|uniref:hypothetical protein n=1 Tax=Bradyrhizobium yuanmingense TaxID=108015 RepID=UPI001CD57602|nr:hypothetical protein [Bradyrhizobium yuanmingense]MCA1528414.1 hypothetical protein [Bradyrhizobium yuanmingense]
MIERYVRKQHIADASFFDMPLLLTEERGDFVSFRDQLTREINPRGILEEIFAAELAAHTWEICRLQRCRTLVINMALENALAQLLIRIVDPDDSTDCIVLARNWFSEPEAKSEVAELLSDIQLDEAAIVAQATRAVYNDLRQLDRMISLQQSLRAFSVALSNTARASRFG